LSAVGLVKEEVDNKLLEILYLELHKQARQPLSDLLWQGGRHYLAYLPRDQGLFSGEAARRVFNQLRNPPALPG
jgi:hypothetical protein